MNRAIGRHGVTHPGRIVTLCRGALLAVCQEKRTEKEHGSGR